MEITNFTIANPTKVLIECGFACNKEAECDAIFVEGKKCHLLKVGYQYQTAKINKNLRWIVP